MGVRALNPDEEVIPLAPARKRTVRPLAADEEVRPLAHVELDTTDYTPSLGESLMETASEYGRTLAGIPTKVRASVAGTLAGMQARTMAELEQGSAAAAQSPEWVRRLAGFEGTPEEAARLRGLTEEQLAIVRETQADLQPTPGASLVERGLETAAISGPPSALAAAVGIATRNPVLAATTMAPTTAGQSFPGALEELDRAAAQQERETLVPRSAEARLADIGRALEFSEREGQLEFGTEIIPFSKYLKAGTPAVQKLAEVMLAELPGETLATLSQAINHVLLLQPEGEAPLDAVFAGLEQGGKQIPETLVSTILGSAAQSAPFILGDAIAGRTEERAPGAAPSLEQQTRVLEAAGPATSVSSLALPGPGPIEVTPAGEAGTREQHEAKRAEEQTLADSLGISSDIVSNLTRLEERKQAALDAMPAGSRALLPGPDTALTVDPEGNVAPRAQIEDLARSRREAAARAEQERLELGMTPDIEANLERLQAAQPEPAPLPALPPPDSTVYVDESGQAGTQAQIEERLRQGNQEAAQAAQLADELGLTADVAYAAQRHPAAEKPVRARAPRPLEAADGFVPLEQGLGETLVPRQGAEVASNRTEKINTAPPAAKPTVGQRLSQQIQEAAAKKAREGGEFTGKPSAVPAAGEIETAPSREGTAPATGAADLTNPDVRAALEGLKQQTGQAAKGGQSIRAGAQVEGGMRGEGQGAVIGRTKWAPRADWWAGRPYAMSEKAVHRVIDLALAGKPLKGRQQEMLDYLLKSAIGGVETERRAGEVRSADDRRAPPPRETPERRQGGRRAAEMTHEELVRELHTSRLTGLKNRRAFDESERMPAVASVDIDGLGWINDTYGHTSGDLLLQAAGQAMREATPNAYHFSGDEFVVEGASEEELADIMERIRERLSMATIEFTKDSGEVVTLEGIGLSYGTGASYEQADTNLRSDKETRRAQGLRAAKGQQPPATTASVRARADHEGDAATAQDAEDVQLSESSLEDEFKQSAEWKRSGETRLRAMRRRREDYTAGYKRAPLSYSQKPPAEWREPIYRDRKGRLTMTKPGTVYVGGRMVMERGNKQVGWLYEDGRVEAVEPTTKLAEEQGDLFGDDTKTKQGVADREREKDAKRSPNRDVDADTGAPGDLFTRRRQMDIGDVKKQEARAPRGWERAEPTTKTREMQAAVDKMFEGAKNAPKAEFVDGPEGLPPHLQEALKRQQTPGLLWNGMYVASSNRVFINSQSVGSPLAAQWTAAHEIDGHRGLIGLFRMAKGGARPALNKALEIAAQNKTIKALAAAIKEKRTKLTHLESIEEALAELQGAAAIGGRYDVIKSRYGVDVPRAMRISKQRNALLRALENFLKRLQSLLERAFGVKFTDKQVADLLEGARRYVREGASSATDKVASDMVALQEAFHGTRHIFDTFDLAKIGTGEGAQAYGWGLYFTSSKDIAEWYRRNTQENDGMALTIEGATKEEVADLPDWMRRSIASNPTLRTVDDHLEDFEQRLTEEKRLAAGSGDPRLDALYRDMGNGKQIAEMRIPGLQRIVDTLQKIREPAVKRQVSGRHDAWLKITKTKSGAIYKVDVPERSELLDLDKRLIDQPPAVLEAIEKAGLYPVAKLRQWVELNKGTTLEENKKAQALADEMAEEVASTRGVATMTGNDLYRALQITDYHRMIREHGKLEDERDKLHQKMVEETVEKYGDSAFVQDVVEQDRPKWGKLASPENYLGPAASVSEKYLERWNELTQRIDLLRSKMDAYRQKDPQKAASLMLLDAGIKGSTYKGRTSNERNFVIWDENAVRVIEREEDVQLHEADSGDVTEQSLREFANATKEKHGLADLTLRLHKNGDIELETIAAKKAKQGAGTAAMRDLVEYADEHGKQIVLSLAEKGHQPIEGGPKTSSSDRLRRFYGRFGFVNNRGKHKDFTRSIYASMYRKPQKRVQTDSRAFKRWFGDSKVVDSSGKPQRVYHGTGRLDRFEKGIIKNRSSSGPMPFFTVNPDVASKYAQGKDDVSFEDTGYDEGWFVFTKDGRERPIGELWRDMTAMQRAKFNRVMPQIQQNEEDYETIEDGGPNGGMAAKGTYEQYLRERRGNGLLAAIDLWLASGALFNEEHRFLDVLRIAGVNEAEFRDVREGAPGVLPVYLKIENPLRTSSIPDDVVEALQQAADDTPAPTKQYGNDPWDKEMRDPEHWMEELRNGMEDGGNTGFVWTSIPDFVTKTLQSLGYDGIHDIGGKLGGENHDVWIPFELEQVKSAVGNKGTFDDSGDMMLSETEDDGQVFAIELVDKVKDGKVTKVERAMLGDGPWDTREEAQRFLRNEVGAPGARVVAMSKEHYQKRMRDEYGEDITLEGDTVTTRKLSGEDVEVGEDEDWRKDLERLEAKIRKLGYEVSDVAYAITRIEDGRVFYHNEETGRFDYDEERDDGITRNPFYKGKDTFEPETEEALDAVQHLVADYHSLIKHNHKEWMEMMDERADASRAADLGFDELKTSEEKGRDVLGILEDDVELSQTADRRFAQRRGRARGGRRAGDTKRSVKGDRGYKAMAQRVIDAFNRKVGWRYGPLGKLPATKAYLAERYQALGRIGRSQAVARSVYDAFKKATPAQAKEIYHYLTTRGALASTISDAKQRNDAIQTKNLIDSVGKRLVEEGMLSQQAYDDHAGEYLPRVYLKHLLGDRAVKAIGSGKTTSDLGYLKQRMSEEQLPKEVREVILGEITDPAFLASFSLGRTLRDLALIDFFKAIAGNKQWVPEGATVEWQGRDVSPFWLDAEAKALRKRAGFYEPAIAKKARDVADSMEAAAAKAQGELEGKDLSDYRQIPDSKRYGVLRGLWVRREIYNDLVGQQAAPGRDGVAEKILGENGILTGLSRAFKVSKVVLNPPSQVRNFISNLMLLQLSGVPAHRIPFLVGRAIRSLVKKDRYFDIYEKYGGTAATWQASEVKQISDEWIRLKEIEKNPLSRMLALGAAAVNKASNAYGVLEGIGKIAKLIDSIERKGMSPADAMLEAHETLFDYSLVHPNVRYLRNNPLGAPFITFQYKVLPSLARTALKHPLRFAPYAMIPYLLSQMLMSDYDVDDDDIEKLKQAFPKWMRERGQMLLLPWKDAEGRWQMIDMGYLVPWGVYADLYATAKEAPGKAAKNALQQVALGGPLTDVAAAIETNTDPFTGKPIVNPADPPADKLRAMMLYAWNLAMPGFLTERGAIPQTVRASQGNVNVRGERGQTLNQAMLRMFGVNVYPVDPEATRAANIRSMEYGIQERETRAAELLRDKNLTPAQRDEIRATWRKIIAADVEALRAYQRASEIHPKLKAGNADETAPD